jgi:hypothetical protein
MSSRKENNFSLENEAYYHMEINKVQKLKRST